MVTDTHTHAGPMSFRDMMCALFDVPPDWEGFDALDWDAELVLDIWVDGRPVTGCTVDFVAGTIGLSSEHTYRGGSLRTC